VSAVSVHVTEVEIVGYVTREFAHLETLERAKRWLIEVGFHPSRIEVHTQGTPRMTVSVESGQADEVQRVLDAVASGDPDGSPSFWDHSKHPLGASKHENAAPLPAEALHSETFHIGWKPLDPDREVTSTDTEKQKSYRDERE
jgi:hypothetical protein